MTRKFLLPLLTFLVIVPAAAHAQQVNAKEPSGQAAIRRVLDAQVAAWNKGDLEGYMDGYWQSPDLVFFSGGTRAQGWGATLAHYKKRYQEGGKDMGKLELRNLDIQMLGPGTAFARGEWHLTMKDGSQPHGLTTLIFRHFPKQGWRIIHDHSCSD